MNRGFAWPRLYDLLLKVLTRGRGRAYRKELLDLAGVEPGQRVLDIGCGTGTQAIAASERVGPTGAVTGVDLSPSMLAAARRKARRARAEIQFERADAAALPFDDGRFDVVTVTTVLHAIPGGRREAGLREAARVLKPGGRLLLIDFAGDRQERRSWISRHGAHGAFDLRDLRQSLAEAGFEEIEGGPLDWMSLHFLRATRPDGREGALFERESRRTVG